MNVFSERAGSPRYPSASFARVGEALSEWINPPADSQEDVAYLSQEDLVYLPERERWTFVRREGDVFLYARKVKGQYEPDWYSIPVSSVGRPVLRTPVLDQIKARGWNLLLAAVEAEAGRRGRRGDQALMEELASAALEPCS